MIALHVNGKKHQVNAPKDVPLLWVLREHLNLTGTKFGCGVGLCGSCTVHVDGEAQRSCTLPAGNVEGKKVVTIEGLPPDHPIKKAWIEEQVPQCGYCQSGQMMQAAALLASNPSPSDANIISAMNGNLCRCGTYEYIKKGIKRAAKEANKS